MGVNFYIPLFIYLAIFLYLLVVPEQAILVIELIITPLSSWWTIWYFHDYLCRDGKKVLVTYPTSHLKYLFNHFYLYVLLYLLLILMLNVIFFEPVYFISSLIQFTSQASFFIGTSLFFMAVFRSVDITISIIVFNVISQIIDIGHILMLYNPFFFNQEILPIGEVIDKSLNNLLYGIVAYWIAKFLISE